MATDITLVPLATRTTTTKVESMVQPYEVDTNGVGDAIDVGDERAVSLGFTWQREEDAALRLPSISIAIEASHDGQAWFEFANFPAVALNARSFGTERIGFVAPAQYLRARWLISAPGVNEKRKARFSVTGRST